jgi:methanogenic corrinoid protein MtbC1
LTEHQGSLEQCLLAADRLAARQVLAQVRQEHDAAHVGELLLTPVLERIGQSWEQGQVSLSQVYMSGRICEELVELITGPVPTDASPPPRVAIAALYDYHLLGKRLVSSVLRAAGWPLLDYGRMEVEPLAQRVQADGIRVLLISVLMLRSALQVASLRHALDRDGSAVRIGVGGAPLRLDPELWHEVGADAMGRTAAEAPSIVTRLQ